MRIPLRFTGLAAVVLVASPALAGKPAPKPVQHELVLVMNDSDSAQKVMPRVLELLKLKGFDLTDKPVVGDLKNKKVAKTALHLDVLKPSTCFVNGSAEELPSGNGIWTWQTKNDRDTCAAQVEQAIESFAAKHPPEKPYQLRRLPPSELAQ